MGACGEGAVLSGRAAAHLLGILKGSPPPPEVSCPTYRRIPGIRTRRRRVHRRDVFEFRGIRVTTVPRTLVDLAAELTIDELALVCHEAGVRYRAKPKQVAAVVARMRKSPPGIGNLRLVMIGDVPVLLGELEKGFFARLREARLPLPVTNKSIDERRVDCRWAQYGLTVELLSYRFHNSRHSWEQDHERRREARARDDQFRTYTWKDVFENPAPMIEELTELLRNKPASPSCPF